MMSTKRNYNSNPAVMARAAELKTKLQELSKVIVENEDCTSETIDQAQETLAALRNYQLYASAQHRPHVPKFGSWEGDNVRYTTYFENARIAKAAEKINPNDPEALVNGLEGLNSLQDPLNLILNKNESVEEHSNQGRNTHNHQKSGSSESSVSESGSDKSDSGHLLRHSSQKRRVKKGSDDRSKSFSEWARTLSTARSGSESHRRGASVPKFGDWDERDPSSGEAFTPIFEKLKAEKQIIASGELQAVPYSDSDNQTSSKPSPCRSLMFCCLIPSRSG